MFDLPPPRHISTLRIAAVRDNRCSARNALGNMYVPGSLCTVTADRFAVLDHDVAHVMPIRNSMRLFEGLGNEPSLHISFADTSFGVARLLSAGVAGLLSASCSTVASFTDVSTSVLA